MGGEIIINHKALPYMKYFPVLAIKLFLTYSQYVSYWDIPGHNLADNYIVLFICRNEQVIVVVSGVMIRRELNFRTRVRVLASTSIPFETLVTEKK